MKQIPVRNINFSNEQLLGRINIRKVQDIQNGNDLLHELHRHNFFFILALQYGEGIHEIDFETYKILDKSIFILRPGQVHQLKLKAGAIGYLMEFDSEFYHPDNKTAALRFQKANSKNFCIPEKIRFEKLHAILSIIFEECANKQEGYLEVVKANLDIFFIEFVRQSPEPGNRTKPVISYTQERFEEFVQLVEKHINIHKQVSKYTNLMGLSPYQLNEITKSAVGKTASALITDQIILEAKRQLLATPNQIKDIADQLGYEDISYFIRLFKKHTGHSPKVFRKNFK